MSIADSASLLGNSAVQAIADSSVHKVATSLTGDPTMDLLSTAGVGGLLAWTASKLLQEWSKRTTERQEATIESERKTAEQTALNEQASRDEHRARVMDRLERHSKAFEDLFELNRASVASMTNSIGELSKQISVLIGKMDVALEKGADDLSMAGLRNHFGIWAGKLHYEIYLWYDNRILENHILDDPDKVGKKYSEMLGSILQRWRYQLEAYKNKGEPMTNWDPDLEGITSVYRKLLARMYQDQVAKAMGKDPYYRNLLVELDHIQSRIMGSVVRYAASRKVLKEDLLDEENSHLESLGIEFLQDPN